MKVLIDTATNKPFSGYSPAGLRGPAGEPDYPLPWF
jgi:hypothetical protein